MQERTKEAKGSLGRTRLITNARYFSGGGLLDLHQMIHHHQSSSRLVPLLRSRLHRGEDRMVSSSKRLLDLLIMTEIWFPIMID